MSSNNTTTTTNTDTPISDIKNTDKLPALDILDIHSNDFNQPINTITTTKSIND